MKQSNILLGIGIIVAVIIIAASFFLKAEPLEHQSSTKKINPVAAVSQSAKNIALVPIKILSRHIIKIH
jgi:hypothetical protein